MAECKDCFHFEVCTYASPNLPVCDSFANDVAPMRHGRWVYAKTYYDIDECNCSLCGQLMTTAIDKRMNYCPNCGAKMDLVDDNDTL